MEGAHSGRDVAVRAHFDRSYRLSLAAGSPALAANMCASMSHLAGQLGQVDDALRLAQIGQARAEAGGVARPHAMQVEALAASGDSAVAPAALAIVVEWYARTARGTTDRDGDGGLLTEANDASITFRDQEIGRWRFLGVDDARDGMRSYIFRRLTAAVDALSSDETR